MSSADSGKTNGVKDDSKFEFPASIAASVALLVAALAAIGVSGGALSRAVRNAPGTLAFVICLTLVAALAVPATLLFRAKKPLAGWTLVAVTLLSMLAVSIGAASLDDRDKPLVALSTTVGDKVTTLKVKAVANGLRSNEDMLVQVHGIEVVFPQDPNAFNAARPGCETSRFHTSTSLAPGPLLAWTQAGPGADGTATAEVAVDVPTGRFVGACAVAIYGRGETNWIEQLFDVVEQGLFRPTGLEGKSSLAFVQLVT